MRILGIESSCDDTGVAIFDTQKGLLANQTNHQTNTHRDLGGVVPELASREHVLHIMPLVTAALKEANISKNDINAIAYTQGPGLIGSLIVGCTTAKTLAYTLNIPAIGIHHLEGHLLAPMLEPEKPEFPLLGLLVSGGHSQLIQVNQLGDYHILGESLDDAAGEAFDKTARLLGLGYPGGPLVADLASKGRPRFNFPRPLAKQDNLNFSFSGLKTHVMTTINRLTENGNKELDLATKQDIAFAFEEAVIDSLLIKCKKAVSKTGIKTLVITGGVSANKKLRSVFSQAEGFRVFYPDLKFCTDNAAMIACAAAYRLLRGERDHYIDILPKARWPLHEII